MKKKSILLCLAAALLVGLTIRPGLLASATSMSSITSDSIKEKQEQIEQAEKEKETLQSNLSDLKEIKENLETEKTNLTNYVAELVRKKMGIDNILINCIGTVIGSHTGPGVVAVFCMGDHR